MIEKTKKIEASFLAKKVLIISKTIPINPNKKYGVDEASRYGATVDNTTSESPVEDKIIPILFFIGYFLYFVQIQLMI